MGLGAVHQHCTGQYSNIHQGNLEKCLNCKYRQIDRFQYVNMYMGSHALTAHFCALTVGSHAVHIYMSSHALTVDS